MTISLPRDDDRDSKLALLVDRLGYADDADYFTDATMLELSQVTHAVESAFATMGVVGALCPRSALASGAERRVPVVYVVWAQDGEDAAIKHRAIWSQSVAPLLIVASPGHLRIRNGFDYRAAGPEWPWDILEGHELHPALISLTPSAVRSAAGWRDFSIPTRVDERLGSAIRALSAHIGSRRLSLARRPEIVNSAIGRFLYLYMLFDRGIIDQAWVAGLRDGRAKPTCPDIHLHEEHSARGRPPTPWPAKQVWHLFDAIDDVLNGSIFPLTAFQRRMLDGDTLHLIRRALRSDTIEAGEQQYGFLDIDYSTIRTETVSAIYECFFELEAGAGKKAQGAFYTPPFLVDYILDEIDAIEPITATSRILDPACGSGAFLVGAFRRIVERERRRGAEPSPEWLREILATSIMGIEVKAQAANVARFSLYLTMLDYLPGMTLADLVSEADCRRLFPDLEGRLIVRDTFAPLPPAFRQSATHVLGNPPWTKITGPGSALRYRQKLRRLGEHDGLPYLGANGTTAEAFLWRAANDICAPEGHIAFVLPTKAFIAPAAKEFPQGVSSRLTLHGITNLAHFREKLFANAREAATVIFASPRPPPPLHWTWRYSPKATSQPVGDDGRPWAIVVDRGQVERFRQEDLLLPGHEWFRDLMLQPLDRMIAYQLEDRGAHAEAMTLGGFFRRHGMAARVGDSPTRVNLATDLVLNTQSNDYRDRLGLLPSSTRNYELPADVLAGLAEQYRQLFGGPMILMSRNQTGFHLIEGPVAFSSSLVGLHFTTDRVPLRQRMLVLREIAAYLQTSVGRYLLALFGRLWVFDQRRFEPPDLRRLPFPYRDVDTLLSQPVTDYSDYGFTGFCQKAFGMGDIFTQAVTEHHELREKYQDGKRPAEGAASVSTEQRTLYGRVLLDQLANLLAGAPMRLVWDDADTAQSLAFRILVDPSGRFETAPHSPVSSRTFAEEGAIELDEANGIMVAALVKPDMTSAWTAERAYADALGVAHRVMAA